MPITSCQQFNKQEGAGKAVFCLSTILDELIVKSSPAE